MNRDTHIDVDSFIDKKITKKGEMPNGDDIYIITEKSIQKIKEKLKEGDRKPCIKQSVVAVIMKDGIVISNGSNHIDSNVSECPRMGMETGKGYELCKSVCNQFNHAEVDACIKGGSRCKGADLYLFGHIYICEDCARVCREYGIINVHIVSTNEKIVL